MEVVREETFGPVSPVMTFTDVDDAIRQVNSTAYGLSSGICTQRLDVIMRFVKELNVGSVNIWEVPGYRLEVTPFGGIKDSGTGVRKACRNAARPSPTSRPTRCPGSHKGEETRDACRCAQGNQGP